MTEAIAAPTETAAAAEALARELLDDQLFHHSARSYAWAVCFAELGGVRFDDELLYVAALLHDLALAPALDAAVLPFEVMSGNVTTAFAHGTGWPRERRRRVAEVIRLHMHDDVGPDVDPEAHLLQLAVTADVSGGGVERLPPERVDEVLTAHPRTGFAHRFVGALTDQSARKPGCAADLAIRSGLATRAHQHPWDRPLH